MLVPTSAIAAKWITASNLCFEMTTSVSVAFNKSISGVKTVWLLELRCLVKCLPAKPEEPVTKMFNCRLLDC